MKDVIVVGFMCVLAIAVGAYLFSNGTNLAPLMHFGGPPFTVLAQGDDAKTSDRTNYRVTNSDEMNSLWELVYGGSPPEPPVVDFTQNDVLAVFDGTHTTGGYSVKVTSVKDSNLVRTVTVEHDSPGAGCAVSEALTSPYEVVLVSQMPANETLAHTDIEKTVDCK